MRVAKSNIVLVTPVYRDSKRLSKFGPSLVRALVESSENIKWVIADDGSGDAEVQRVRELVEIYAKDHPEVGFFGKGVHLGKGGTIRAAWEAYSEAEWLAFVDADGSVEAHSIVALIERAVAAGPGHAVISSRAPSRETTVSQGPLRLMAHRGFAFIGRNLLRLPVRDLQCGGKVVHSAAFRVVGPRLVEEGFAFDAELLAALQRHGVRLIEVPIDWAEKSGGSVNALKQAWPMFKALLRIRRRIYAGHYDPETGIP